MENNDVAQDELQQAINNITNANAADNNNAAMDAIAEIEGNVAGGVDLPMPDFPAPAAPEVEMPKPEEVAAAAAPEVPASEAAPSKASYGDPDLDKVRSKALKDIRPILEKVEMSAEKRFIIYKDIIDTLDDKASFEPAYEAAGQIANEKERAEALLYIIEKIDEMGLKKD
jgi:hypothetical protein